MNEIKNEKLNDIINEINEAITMMKSDNDIKPKQYIQIAKVIETGEKKITREFNKRLKQLKIIESEIEALTKFANELGYTIVDHLKG